MATETSRLGLGALVVRAWRIRLARIVMKAAGGLMTIAEHLLPADLRFSRFWKIRIPNYVAQASTNSGLTHAPHGARGAHKEALQSVETA